MKLHTRYSRPLRLLASIALSAVALLQPDARAASKSWTGASGGDWATGSNWNGSSAPLAADTAVFNNSTLNSVAIASGTTINSISFDTAQVGGLVIGGTDGGVLTLQNAGTIQILSTLAGSGKVMTINAPLVLSPASVTTSGTYTFANNNSTATNILTLGGAITAGSTTGTETLILTGANTGNNTISGAISNGGASALNLSKTGAGAWVLTASNTYTGNTTIGAGVLSLAGADGSINSSGRVTVASGATLKLDNSTAYTANHLGGSVPIYSDGGTLDYTINTGAANTTFSTTTGPLVLNSLVSTIKTSEASATSGSSTLTLAGLTRLPGAGLNFNTAGLGNNGNRNFVMVTGSLSNSGGIVGPWATIGNTDYVRYSSNGFMIAAYDNIPVVGGTIYNSGSNVRISQAGTSGNIVLESGTTSINSLVQGSGTAAIIDTASKTLRADGILVGSGKNTLKIGANPGDGILTPATAGGELVINTQYNSTSALTINAAIGDNNTPSSLTKLGAYTAILNSNNTLSGTTYLSQGTLQLGSGAGTQGSLAGPVSFSPGATLAYSRPDTAAAIGGALLGTGGNLSINSGTLTLNSTNLPSNTTTTFGGLTVSNGGLNLSAARLDTGTVGLITLTNGNVTIGNGSVLKTDLNQSVHMTGVSTIWLESGGLFQMVNEGQLMRNVGSGNNVLKIASSSGTPGVSGTLVVSSNGAFRPFGTNNGNNTLTLDNVVVSAGPFEVNRGSGNNTVNVSNGSVMRLTSMALGVNTSNATLNVNAGSSVIVSSGGLSMTNGGANYLNVNGGTVSGVTSITGFTAGGITVTNSGTLSNSAASSIAGSGSATVSGAGSLWSNGSSILTMSGSAATLTVSNGGKLAVGSLTATSGTTIFDNGILAANVAGTLVSGTALVLVKSGGITVDTAFTGTIASALTGDALSTGGGLTKIGTGSLALSGSNSYTGVTAINTGTLGLGNINALAGGGDLQFGGGVLQYSGSNQVDYSNRIKNSSAAIAIDTSGQSVSFASALAASNTAGLTKSGSGVLSLNADNGFTGSTSVASGTLKLGSSLALQNSTFTTSAGALVFDSGVASHAFSFGALEGSSNIALVDNGSNPVSLTVGGNGASTIYSGNLSGAGSLTKSGTGSMTLSGNNSHSGGIVVNSGALIAGSTTGVNGALTMNGGALDLATYNITLSRLNGSAGTQVSTSATNSLTLTVSGSASSEFAGSINDGSGKLGLTKSGAGTLTLAGNNGYTNGTTITGGTLALASGALLGSGTLTVSGGSAFKLAEGAVYNANGQVALRDNSTIFLEAGSLMTAPALPGNDYLPLIPYGSGANGIGRLASSSGIPGVSGTFSTTATFLRPLFVNQGNARFTFDNVVVSATNSQFEVGRGGSNGTVNISNGAQVRVKNVYQVVDAAGSTINVNPNSSLILSNNSYEMSNGSGNNTLNINGGTVTGVSSFALGSGSNNRVNITNGGKLSAGSVNLGAATSLLTFDNGILAASANGTLLSSSGTVGISNGGATIDSGNYAVTVSSALAETGTSTGGGLTKIGAGTLTMSSNANSYTGITNINQGKLVVSGSLSATSALNVASGAALTVNGGVNPLSSATISGTLNGTGMLGAVNVANGGVLAPGNSAGIISMASLSGTTGAVLSIELGKTSAGITPVAGTHYDQVATGSVLLNEMTLSLVDNNAANVQAGDKFFLIINQGQDAVGGTLAGLAQGATFSFAGMQYQISYTANWSGNYAGSGMVGGNDVALLAVPEPSTWAFLLGGLGLLFHFQRARHQRLG